MPKIRKLCLHLLKLCRENCDFFSRTRCINHSRNTVCGEGRHVPQVPQWHDATVWYPIRHTILATPLRTGLPALLSVYVNVTRFVADIVCGRYRRFPPANIYLNVCKGVGWLLNSSLLRDGSRMAKRNTVHKNKSNDQSE